MPIYIDMLWKVRPLLETAKKLLSKMLDDWVTGWIVDTHVMTTRVPAVANKESTYLLINFSQTYQQKNSNNRHRKASHNIYNRKITTMEKDNNKNS